MSAHRSSLLILAGSVAATALVVNLVVAVTFTMALLVDVNAAIAACLMVWLASIGLLILFCWVRGGLVGKVRKEFVDAPLHPAGGASPLLMGCDRPSLSRVQTIEQDSDWDVWEPVADPVQRLSAVAVNKPSGTEGVNR